MTREQLIEKVCLSSEIQNDECIDCAYCMEVLNDYFDKYDKQIRAEVIEETRKECIDILKQLDGQMAEIVRRVFIHYDELKEHI